MTARQPPRDSTAALESKTRTLDRVNRRSSATTVAPTAEADDRSSTTLKALARKPAGGGGYAMVKQGGDAVDASRCEVAADGHNIRIEAGGAKLTLSRSEARTLADKLTRALK